MKNKKKSVPLSSDDEEIAEYEPDLLVQEEEVSSSAVSQATEKRGRPPIPEKWTKVISMEHHNLDNLKTHVIASDLLLAQGF